MARRASPHVTALSIPPIAAFGSRSGEGPAALSMPAFMDAGPPGFDVLGESIAALLRTALAPGRKHADRDIPWTGPDNTRALAATTPSFATQLSFAGLAHHEAHGRDALYMIASILLQLGVVQGQRLARGARWVFLEEGLRARARGADTPATAALTEAFLLLRAGDDGGDPAPRAGQATGVLEPQGPPLWDEELKAPVRAALRFAYDVVDDCMLEDAIEAALAIGIAHGRRIAAQTPRTDLVHALALDALVLGDHAQLARMAALL